VPPFIGSIVWFVVNGMDTVRFSNEMQGLLGIGLQSAGELPDIVYLLAVLPSVAHTSLRNLGFRAPAAGDAGGIAAAIVLMFVLVTALGSLFSAALHFKTPELAVHVFTSLQGWQKALFVLFAVIVGPVWEEFVFRIFLFNAMRKWWGFWPGAIVSSLLFGLAHAQPPFTPAMFVALSFPLAVGGIVLCSVYARTRSAWSNMITHASFNALSLLLITVAPQLAK
jgi:membrane protease YdiL (CAAX protease family)